MDPKENQDALELYTQGISLRALQDAEQFLENSLPGGRVVARDRLLAHILSEEQQTENNRIKLEALLRKKDEAKFDLVENDLKSLEEMRAERDELQKKRQQEKDDITASHKSIDEILRMKRETDSLRDAYMRQKKESMEASQKAHS